MRDYASACCMMRSMRRHGLAIFAAISLLLLVVLVCGCFAFAGLQFRDYTEVNNATVLHHQADAPSFKTLAALSAGSAIRYRSKANRWRSTIPLGAVPLFLPSRSSRSPSLSTLASTRGVDRDLSLPARTGSWPFLARLRARRWLPPPSEAPSARCCGFAVRKPATAA